MLFKRLFHILAKRWRVRPHMQHFSFDFSQRTTILPAFQNLFFFKVYAFVSFHSLLQSTKKGIEFLNSVFNIFFRYLLVRAGLDIKNVAGSGTPEEIMLIWNELEAAKDILYQLETINQETCPVKQKRLDNLFASQTNKENFPVNREKQDKAAGSLFPVLRHSDMQYMDSKTWLHQNGIKTRGLDFYAFLGGVAFRHCDGVVKQSHRVEKSALAQTNENDLPEDPKPGI